MVNGPGFGAFTCRCTSLELFGRYPKGNQPIHRDTLNSSSGSTKTKKLSEWNSTFCTRMPHKPGTSFLFSVSSILFRVVVDPEPLLELTLDGTSVPTITGQTQIFTPSSCKSVKSQILVRLVQTQRRKKSTRDLNNLSSGLNQGAVRQQSHPSCPKVEHIFQNTLLTGYWIIPYTGRSPFFLA